MHTTTDNRAMLFRADDSHLPRNSGCDPVSLLRSTNRTSTRSSAAMEAQPSGPTDRVISTFGCDSTATVLVGGTLPGPLAHVFSNHREIRLVSVCERSADMLRTAEKQDPDVLLLATQTTRFDLVTVLREIHARCTTKTLILTDRRDPDFIESILRHGAKGCVGSTSAGDDVVRAIVAVKRGELWLERRSLANALYALISEPKATRTFRRPSGEANLHSESPLTPRERQIAALLAHGLTNKDIAKRINVSAETVKKHLQSVFNKLGMHRRTLVVRDQLLGG